MSNFPEPHDTAAGASWIATRLIYNRISARIAEVHESVNIEQLFLLMELDKETGLRPSMLADRMLRSKGTISSLIKHAQKNDLICSTPDPLHKNAKKLHLTEYGKKLLDELNPIIYQELEGSMEGVPPEHQAMIIKVMQNIIKAEHPDYLSYYAS
ncbi:hypothetical protein A3K86_16635 [Photobacterium jeanii]|uniref:HTH marR-type domain-containing protein n=1 Tax=Photobacterium jeanii TaxID=858640 RepID=A0A178K7K7_9GAMM|nr:MarR family winged helix-turn-helix transcriptional regulator [Photobacterium jeanii]OAN13281.1 hypothetical protein A3K86_16635 [Photobacterium jeanii]PST90279.1 MarR family transcriptional regulator [Photobacterium jeanii]